MHYQTLLKIHSGLHGLYFKPFVSLGKTYAAFYTLLFMWLIYGDIGTYLIHVRVS
ncbi:hypothetical protein Lalb_Chr12g0204001 [Lupinus albus]|uniref:Uncharacterized protein n=1 Tax=Lupinus albus TaxID=3870 RepID=A0A6A4PMT5_LUPAL|nr:hypothetical protein Lalb_Chr12g0204001 [Lupinus albus]